MDTVPDTARILQLLQTPQGKQLMSALRRADPDTLSKAAGFAASGDLEDAKKLLRPLLEDRSLQALLDALGR